MGKAVRVDIREPECFTKGNPQKNRGKYRCHSCDFYYECHHHRGGHWQQEQEDQMDYSMHLHAGAFDE